MAGSKNAFTSPLISAGDMTTTLTGGPTNIQYYDNISLEFNWAGGTTPKGTIQVLVSNSYDARNGIVYNAGVFTPLALSPNPVVPGSSNSGSLAINLTELAFSYIKVIYTPDGMSPGSGNLNCLLTAKSISG